MRDPVVGCSAALAGVAISGFAVRGLDRHRSGLIRDG
jgi:hypothetical protein